MSNSCLYVIATPIGNLGDITLRALETLKRVDLVLCEDTRQGKKLLEHFQIKKTLNSYHQHSTLAKTREILEMLACGKNLALITDAGTPCISDPGADLVCSAVKKGFSVVPIPGPSALTTILSVTGFTTDKFIFLGFPPHKNKRQKFFVEAVAHLETVVFYESGHRILKCLTELSAVLDPHRELVVGRELTKQFETLYRGTIDEIKENMKDERGEFVIVISPQP